MSADRPQFPTLDELRDVVQPPHIRNRATAEHWTGTLYMRHISIYLTWLLVRTPISANGVTTLMIIAGIAAGPALLLPGLWGPLVAVLLTQLQLYLDASDGEVARWRGTSSPKGIFLDQIGHWSAEGSIGLFIGLRAAGFATGLETDATAIWQYACLGAATMAGIWLNKGLNTMVTVARVNAGLPKLPDEASSRALPANTLLGVLRRAARFIPFHRLYHSIELTLLTLAVALATFWLPDTLAVDRGYAVVMGVAIWLVILGHFLAIWASPRLKK